MEWGGPDSDTLVRVCASRWADRWGPARVGVLNRTIHFPGHTDLQWPVIESHAPCINNVGKTYEELGCQTKKTNTRYPLTTRRHGRGSTALPTLQGTFHVFQLEVVYFNTLLKKPTLAA